MKNSGRGTCFQVTRCELLMIIFVMEQSGVLIYKTVSDRLVTREQPREMDIMGRTAFTGSKFIYLSFFYSKKLFLLIFSILSSLQRKSKGIIYKSF